MNKPTVLDSLNNALLQTMARNEQVFILGEDILDPYGGAFKVTRGLSTAFPSRVITTPISEAGIVGVAAGMAMRGLRPVVEIMFGDFITLAADQLINHIGKFRWMYNDQVTLPLVIRTPMGGRRGYGPTHSQTLEKLFLGVPGLTVLAPFHLSTRQHGLPGDLLSWAIQDQESPILFIENKLQYSLPLLDEESLVDFEVDGNLPSPTPTLVYRIRGAPPASLTLIAYGSMAELARQAQLELAFQHEIFTELIIPTKLSPFDGEWLFASVNRTHRLLVIEEGTRSLGWGAEILARVVEDGSLKIDCARRLSAPDQPVPASTILEGKMLPGSADIIQMAKMMV